MNFGITTCSSAFTRLFVTLIFSSRVRKEAWRDAIWMSKSRIALNFYLHFWMEYPPLSMPIWLIALSASSCSLRFKLGIKTPAMFYSDLSIRIVALLTASATFPLNIKVSTGTIRQHIWLQPSRRRLLCNIIPFSSCFQAEPSWLLWTFSWGHQLFSSTARDPF